ncbi:MAG: Na+/H+ antiporter NhaC family protein [Roseibacillus sp.]
MKLSKGSLLFFSLILVAILVILFFTERPQPILPPLIALALLALTGRAGLSLLAGSLAGVLLIDASSPITSPIRLLTEHLWPALTSTWHWSALIFTLLLAAFAAIVERSGALAGLLQRWSKTESDSSSRLQVSIVGLGLVCFFDGLANALMLGRVGRSLADQAGLSREKLAYLVDTTSSAVACVAFLSTWSVFQLTLIASELEGTPFTEPAYLYFLQSIPTNFYCLGSLLLVFLAARWNWNPPPMDRAKAQVTPKPPTFSTGDNQSNILRSAIGPIAVLVLSVPLSFWVLGGGKWFPTSLGDIQNAFATSLGPYALLLAGALSILGALAFFPQKKKEALSAIPSGVRSLLPALVVLVMAWTLGSTLSELKTGDYLASLLGDRFQVSYLPGATFILGCLIAFSTGTSWGTMALLMPLALGTFLSMTGEHSLDPATVAPLLPAIIAAVFGGAVFGDHASPFSDTTIVSALACDITTTRHVATQLPYALLASGCAVLFGYLPIGLGLTPSLASLLPLVAIGLVVYSTRKRWGK